MLRKKNEIPRNVGNLFRTAFNDAKEKTLPKFDLTQKTINVTLENIYKG